MTKVPQDFVSPKTLLNSSHDSLKAFQHAMMIFEYCERKSNNPERQKWKKPPQRVDKVNWDIVIDKKKKKMGWE